MTVSHTYTWATVSHHMLRRTARKARRKYDATHPNKITRVESSRRGPFGWRVEERTRVV